MGTRKFTRIPFTREVRLSFHKTVYDSCRLKDLSLSGMYVFGAFIQQVGDACRVHLSQKGLSTLLEINALAKVVRVGADGLAIQFTAMNYDSYMYLETTLLYEAGDPLLISLELPDKCPFEILDVAQEPIMRQ